MSSTLRVRQRGGHTLAKRVRASAYNIRHIESERIAPIKSLSSSNTNSILSQILTASLTPPTNTNKRTRPPNISLQSANRAFKLQLCFRTRTPNRTQSNLWPRFEDTRILCIRRPKLIQRRDISFLFRPNRGSAGLLRRFELVDWID